ncbi:MAG: hypothetical protein EOP49_30680, partial [Sphingobacteriales bacterium]
MYRCLCLPFFLLSLSIPGSMFGQYPDTSGSGTVSRRQEIISSKPDRLSARPNNVSLEINGMYGFLMANQPKAYYVRNDQSRMLELNISRQTDGSHSWHHASNFPRTGLAILYGGVGSAEHVGNILAIYPFIHFPLKRNSRWQMSFRLGTGLGWVGKPYDKERNYKNLMIGTHLNATISMRLQSELRLSQHVSMNAGISFSHLSNGTFRLPNLGLNVPAISLGLRYHSEEKIIQATGSAPGKPPGMRYAMHVAGAFKQTYPLESKVGFVKLMQVEAFRNYRKSSRFGAGIMISHDKSLSNEVANAPTYIFDKSDPQWQVGVYVGYH